MAEAGGEVSRNGATVDEDPIPLGDPVTTAKVRLSEAEVNRREAVYWRARWRVGRSAPLTSRSTELDFQSDQLVLTSNYKHVPLYGRVV